MLAKIEGGDCESIQHLPIATLVGVAPAQADAIAQQSVGSPCFSVVELIVAIGYYVMMARFTELMRTDLDPSAGTKIMDTLHR